MSEGQSDAGQKRGWENDAGGNAASVEGEEQQQQQQQQSEATSAEARKKLASPGIEDEQMRNVTATSSSSTAATTTTADVVMTSSGNEEGAGGGGGGGATTTATDITTAAAASGGDDGGGGASFTIKGNPVNFKVVFKKESWDLKMGEDNMVTDLKAHLQTLSGVPKEMQKLMFKGMMKDEQTLGQGGVKDGIKIMLVGTSLQEVVNVASGSAAAKADGPVLAFGELPPSTPLCQIEQHKKVIEKGLPPNALPGIRGVTEPLPANPIQGVLNRRGEPVQVSYKWDRDEVWVGSKTHTEKIASMSISNVTSEAIVGNEGYHIVSLQVGSHESSKVYLYFFPAQYVSSLRRAIMQ